MDFFSASPSRSRPSFTQERLTTNMLSRIINRPKMNSRQQLELIVEVDKDIQLFQQNKLKLLSAKTLYNEGMFSMAQLYKHYREEQLCVIGNDSASVNLISPESLRQIEKSNMSLMHMGLIVVGLKILTRKNLGTKVLVVIYDNRWPDLKRSIIGITEVDMSTNGGLFYCSPDYMINSLEFGKYIKIGIQTKWYEEITNENNLLICVGFIGKLDHLILLKIKLEHIGYCIDYWKIRIKSIREECNRETFWLG